MTENFDDIHTDAKDLILPVSNLNLEIQSILLSLI